VRVAIVCLLFHPRRILGFGSPPPDSRPVGKFVKSWRRVHCFRNERSRKMSSRLSSTPWETSMIDRTAWRAPTLSGTQRLYVGRCTRVRHIASWVISILIIAPIMTRTGLAESATNAYVTNVFPPSVSVIDTTTNTVIVDIGFPTGRAPFAIAITPDGASGYVTALNSLGTTGGWVYVLDTRSNTIVGGPIEVGSEPTGIAITPDGKRAYVANRFGASEKGISVIDTSTNTVAVTVPMEGMPRALAITPDGKRVYVSNEGLGAVQVLDVASNTISGAAIPVGGAAGIAIAPSGTQALVTNNNAAGFVSVIDTASNAVVSTVAVEEHPSAVAFTADGKYAYVTNQGSRSVSVIDASSMTVIGSPIPVGTFPGAIALTYDGKRALVTNEGSNSVSVIHTGTGTVGATIGGMGSPRGVAIAPPAPLHYVAEVPSLSRWNLALLAVLLVAVALVSAMQQRR